MSDMLSRVNVLRAKYMGNGSTYFAPVLSTDRSPPCFLAVTSHAINEQIRPKMGERAAAARFCLLHIKVKQAGITADEMITPWQ